MEFLQASRLDRTDFSSPTRHVRQGIGRRRAQPFSAPIPSNPHWAATKRAIVSLPNLVYYDKTADARGVKHPLWRGVNASLCPPLERDTSRPVRLRPLAVKDLIGLLYGELGTHGLHCRHIICCRQAIIIGYMQKERRPGGVVLTPPDRRYDRMAGPSERLLGEEPLACNTWCTATLPEIVHMLAGSSRKEPRITVGAPAEWPLRT